MASNAGSSDDRARDGVVSSPDVLLRLSQYRPFLKELACRKLPDWLRSRLDPSDLVQETLLRAHDRAEQFAGTSEPEYCHWLTAILESRLLDAIRYHGRSRRDARLEQSSLISIAGNDTSPSGLFRRSELEVALQRALTQLPADYREVILLRQDQELGFAEIGALLGKSADATRMLWGRAILQLGRLLKAHHDSSQIGGS